ncbi:TOBE domain-containing protein, partial [Thermoproteota archaeon]
NMQVTIVIRDENIVLSKDNMSGENVFEGKVENILYLGSFQRTYVQVNGLSLSIHHKHDQFGKMYVKGESIFVKLDMQYLLVLPGDFEH